MCPTRPLIAVGANNRRIRVFELSRPPSFDETRVSTPALSQVEVRESWDLSGHRHNVPCIDISEDGQLMAR